MSGGDDYTAAGVVFVIFLLLLLVIYTFPVKMATFGLTVVGVIVSYFLLNWGLEILGRVLLDVLIPTITSFFPEE